MLAERRAGLSQFEDIPFPGHDFTVYELKQALEQSTGQSLQIDKFPWAMIWLLSPFWNLAYEMLEMRGLWETSHRLGGEKFRKLLPAFEATELEEVMCCSFPRELQAPLRA